MSEGLGGGTVLDGFTGVERSVCCTTTQGHAMAVAMAFAASGLFGDASSGLRCAQRVKCSEGGGEGELGGSLEGAWGPRQAGPGLAPLPSQWARPTTLSPVARPPHFWPQPQRTIEGTILTSPLRASSETLSLIHI